MQRAVASLLVLAVLAVPAALAQTKPRVISLSQVGGLQVSERASYSEAVNRFGPLKPPTASLRFLGGVVCRFVVQPLGLTIDFGVEALQAAEPSSCTDFLGAMVTRPGWRTPKGLHVGSSLKTLRYLYPSSLDVGLIKPVPGLRNWTAWWWLTPSNSHSLHPILTARVTGGRVVAIGVDMVGH